MATDPQLQLEPPLWVHCGRVEEVPAAELARRRELVEAYLAGYGQAVEDFRGHAVEVLPARRRRPLLRWAVVVGRILGITA